MQRLVQHLLEAQPGPLARYGAALGLTALAALGRVALVPVLQGEAPYATFFIAILLSSLLGGMGPGLLAIPAGLVALALVEQTPVLVRLGGDPAAVVTTLAIYFLFSIMLVAVTSALRGSVAAAQRAARQWRGLFNNSQQAFVLYQAVQSRPDGPYDDLARIDMNPAARRGSRIDVRGRTLRETYPDIDRAWVDDFLRVALTGEPEHFERYWAVGDRWCEIDAFSPAPGQCATLITDVTHRKREAQVQAIQARETDHRARNLLGLILSIVQMTRGGTVEAYREALSGRLQALARAHSVLATGRWEGADLADILEKELAAFADLQGTGGMVGARLDGPPLLLPLAESQGIAMVVHELATNAAKYGALSLPGGSVAVGWRLADGPEPQVELTWTESGGPPTAPPDTSGFGSALIETVVTGQLRGDLSLDWSGTGLVARIRFPLPGAGDDR